MRPFGFHVGRGPKAASWSDVYREPSTDRIADTRLDCFTMSEPCPCGGTRGVRTKIGVTCRKCGQPVDETPRVEE